MANTSFRGMQPNNHNEREQEQLGEALKTISSI
jgi:hypothetical protein